MLGLVNDLLLAQPSDRTAQSPPSRQPPGSPCVGVRREVAGVVPSSSGLAWRTLRTSPTRAYTASVCVLARSTGLQNVVLRA